MIGLGAADVWTSPALPHLKSNESEIKISPAEASWIASLLHVGAIFGYFLYPYMMDSIGRKYTLLFLCIPQLASWITTILARDVYTLYASRTISGVGYCAACAVQGIYISEISSKNIRGILLLCSEVNYQIGTLMLLIIGALCSYKDMNLSMLSTPLLFLLTFIFMPDTPHYYLKKGNDKKAFESLSRLRGTKNLKILEPEIVKIKKAIIEGQESNQNAMRQLFVNKRYRRALLIVLIANATKGLSGSFVIGTYTEQIFTDSGFTLAPEYSTIIVAVVKIIAGLIGSQLIEYVGRRVLYFYSGIVGSLSLVVVGLFFFLKLYLKIDHLSAIGWLPLFGLASFQIVSAASLNPIPVVLILELFPTDVKSLASAIAFIVFELFVFFITFIFDGFNGIVGIYTTFWIYAVVCITGTYTIFCITPETKGKSLEEIQDLLD